MIRKTLNFRERYSVIYDMFRIPMSLCFDSLWRFLEMNEKKKIQYRGVFRHYIRIPLYLMIILAALNVGVYLINVEAGLLVSVGVLFCLLVAVIIYNFQKKSVLNDLVAFANSYSGVEKKLLDNLALSFCHNDFVDRFLFSFCHSKRPPVI